MYLISRQKICHVIHCDGFFLPSRCDIVEVYIYTTSKKRIFKACFYTADIVCMARKGGPEDLRCDLSLNSSCQAPTCGSYILCSTYHFSLHSLCYNVATSLYTFLWTLKPKHMTSHKCTWYESLTAFLILRRNTISPWRSLQIREVLYRYGAVRTVIKPSKMSFNVQRIFSLIFGLSSPLSECFSTLENQLFYCATKQYAKIAKCYPKLNVS